MILKKKNYLYGLVRGNKCIWWVIENSYLLVYKLFEFAVEWIPGIRSKAEVIFISKNHLHYCKCWWESNKCVLCI